MKEVNKNSVAAKCVGGFGSLAMQHMLCPGHGTIALGAKVIVGTGAISTTTLEQKLAGIENSTIRGLECVGMSDPAAHATYHYGVDGALPIIGWGLLGHTAYRMITSRKPRKPIQSPVETADYDFVDGPVEWHPKAYRFGEHHL